jgi:ribonuclease J
LETEEEKQLAASFKEEGVEQRHLHSSGHASRTDLVKFLEGVDAKRIVVVHSESPAALQDVFPNVVATKDGETITI